MIFRIEVTSEENQRACLAAVLASVPPSRANLVISGVYAALGVGAYLVGGDRWLATVLLVIGGSIAVQYAVQAEWRWRLRRARAGDPHADEPYQLEISEAGIRMWCDHVDTRYAWHGITRVVETPELYMFLRGPDGGPTLPKRFVTAAAEAELRARIREWAPDGGAHLSAEATPAGASAAVT